MHANACTGDGKHGGCWQGQVATPAIQLHPEGCFSLPTLADQQQWRWEGHCASCTAQHHERLSPKKVICHLKGRGSRNHAVWLHFQALLPLKF